MHGFVTTNCKTSGTPELFEFVRFEFVREQFVFLFIFYFYFMSMLQSRMLQRRVWKLEAMRKQCGHVRSLQKFGVLQAAFMGSNVSRTVKICVSKLFQMAELPKAVVVESENAPLLRKKHVAQCLKLRQSLEEVQG